MSTPNPWAPPPSATAAAQPRPDAGDPPPDAPVAPGEPGADERIEWRRLHKVTPLLNAWKAAAVILGLAVWNYGEDLAQLDLAWAMKILLVVGAIVLGAIIGLVYGAIAWRRTRYGIGEESVFLHSGVLWRQQRHVRLDRLQAVDVTQPLLARLFGFSSLKIESAGGAGSNLTLSYLTDTEAQRVRNEILARAAGVRRTGQAPGAAPAPAQEAPERPLLELGAGRLVGSLVRSGFMIVTILLVAGLVLAIALTRTFQLAGALPGVLAAVGYAWSRFAGEFSFRLGLSADGIRLRHGLLEAKARTVPPGRVQALSFSQPPLWRRKGWWRVRMNVAGYGGEGEETTTVLYPVATTEEVALILPLVLPDLGTDRPLEVLQAALTGTGTDEGFIISPRRARVFDPLTWRRNGVRITDTAVLIRTGLWWRTLAVVPHERTQSLAMTQGPLERRRGLAGVDLHSTSGPVTATIVHLDVETARTLLLEQAERARRARRHAGPERWMSRRGGGEPDAAALRAGYAGVLPAVPAREEMP